MPESDDFNDVDFVLAEDPEEVVEEELELLVPE